MTPELRKHARLPLVLLALLALICVVTVWSPPAGRVSWCLEVGPGLVEVAVLAAVYRRLPLSHLVYIATFLHLQVLIYGGFYTYALTPLGDWAKEALHLTRNHYDRVGHFALGVVPCLLTREVLLRCTPLRRGGWLFFLVCSVVLAFAAFWELLEWWTALLAAPDVGTAFLGSQGDVWDAQWDMVLALIGALITLPLLGRAHDASMAKVPAPAK
ncbi:MAG: DUF2238 domain-containing protein [Myxococcales bacterium]|nr:MAG: DUF2238 domain-containing protein [Myxococcales bacterium]